MTPPRGQTARRPASRSWFDRTAPQRFMHFDDDLSQTGVLPMIKHLAACAALAFCLAGSGRALAGGNLVVNGGFETGDFTDWLLRGDSVFTFVGSDLPHSGKYAADLGTSVQGGVVSIEQSLSTIPGKPYLLSFWLENDGGTPNSFAV